ncbi:UNVERIFIED_CONTAM: Methylsterol monooxygenase 1-1 [Sesamum calycinum]|uniref:Methylsterol monooxygenase 1-1 n=1 Tax=Sesamum calycinum TaxID=2727403 RepID=A0AAW2QZ48_9LAMI
MLPYTTVEAAEAALGRSLSAAETLWLNYSANKSDYFLYCHNILFLFLIFSLFPFYYLFLEYFFQKSVGPYKIQPKVKLSFSDTLRCYKSVMRMFFLVVGPLQLVSFPSIKVSVFWSFNGSAPFFECFVKLGYWVLDFRINAVSFVME